MTKSKKDESLSAKDSPVIDDSKKPEQTNPVEESKQDGTATTDEGVKVELQPGALPENPPAADTADQPNPNRELSAEELEELAGELTNAESGYLPLDKDGYITGPAKRGTPPEDSFYAPVICNDTGSRRDRGLTTPSGAPITRKMNPVQQQAGDDHNRHAREALEEQSGDENDGA